MDLFSSRAVGSSPLVPFVAYCSGLLTESHGYIVISRPIVAVKAGTFLEGGGRAWSCGRDTPIDRCRDRAGAIRLLPGRRARDACNADLDAFAALRSLRRCAHSN